MSVSRFFVENRHVAWVLLVGAIAWGIWSYAAMPKRKDPDIPVRQVAVVTPWPGQNAERVEQLVTRKIEERVAQNIRVAEITSTWSCAVPVRPIRRSSARRRHCSATRWCAGVWERMRERSTAAALS